MNDSTVRFIFATLCTAGLITIWGAVLFELRRQQQSATISQRHLRWRMVSAVLWTLILGCLTYGTLFSWPVHGDAVSTKRFGAILGGSILLMMVAFVVIIFDFYLTVQTRKIQTARMQQDLGEIARLEIERAKRAHQEKESGENV
jgi:hypothetical protein